MLREDLFAPGTPGVVGDVEGDVDCDIVVVGSGMGGATLAWALKDSGARVLVLESGGFLPRERENWSARAVHMQGRYKNSALWIDETGREFMPGNYHYVGGNTKLYGATLPRFRERDFEDVETHDGRSPAWPISYRDLEPYYAQAEARYVVHGEEGDPTEPWRSSPYPNPPVPHDPAMGELVGRLRRQGLQPFALPQAVDWGPGGNCVLCRTCDSYNCMVDAKGDADLRAMRPAIASPTVRLMTGADVRAVRTEADGARVAHLDVRRNGRNLRVRAHRYVLAAGAVNTAALLLRSRDDRSPDGVANSSGMVGRNYMAHVSSFLVGGRPGKDPLVVYSKTVGLNDWYWGSDTSPYPLGNVQALGKIQGPTIKPQRPWVPLGVLEWASKRTVDFFVETEDVPLPENRVHVDSSGRIHLLWRQTNLGPHAELVKRMSKALRRAGYPLIFTQKLGIEATSHQVGTVRMGTDPTDSVVDPSCRAHDVENLWVVDGSVFPSSAAVNPALTIAANVLRVADTGTLAA